ncbi:hypothetical protein ACP70R_045826 [Stipagrostis hirtigluma subsp. patula]
MVSKVSLLLVFARFSSITLAIMAMKVWSSDDSSQGLNISSLGYSILALFFNITFSSTLAAGQLGSMFRGVPMPMPGDLFLSGSVMLTDWFLTCITFGTGFASLFVTLYVMDSHFVNSSVCLTYMLHSIFCCLSGAFAGLVLLCESWIAFQIAH